MNRSVPLLFAATAIAAVSAQEVPVSLDPRLTVELVAKEPEIRTPVGIQVDERGRLWVIENNTHFRPANYIGAPTDRILVFEDFGPDGRSRKVSIFADGFRNSMGIMLGTRGEVYLATRADLHVLRDTDGDGRCDSDTVIVKLETAGNYPHNGLAGFARDGLGRLVFGFGENLGATYKLIGSDGITLTGGGEGGNVYRCKTDGSKLELVSTGYWNPFHICSDVYGRLFAVDNDPDSRPPCRLMQVIDGSDYGYRFRNGRKGLHPFTSWNGELPGTLPMVAGTAEAPSGVMAYESLGFPEEYRGDLLATSWGDHVVQRFKLTPRGAGLTSKAQTLIKGGEFFRPVGIAAGPDGSVYVTDWADKSYPLHGKGRIWRIKPKVAPKPDPLMPTWVAQRDAEQMREYLAHARPDIRFAAADTLGRRANSDSFHILGSVLLSSKDARVRLECLRAIATYAPPAVRDELLRQSAHDPVPEIRAHALHLAARSGTKISALDRFVLAEPNLATRAQAISMIADTELLKSALPVALTDDPYLHQALSIALARPGHAAVLLQCATHADAKMRIAGIVAKRLTGAAFPPEVMKALLDDTDPQIRRTMIQWVAEDKLKDYADLLPAAVAKKPITRALFESYVAAREILAGAKPGSEQSGQDYAAKLVADASQPAVLRALALRSLPPEHAVLTADRLKTLLADRDADLSIEALRTLAGRTDEASQAELLKPAVGADDGRTRAWALLGLSHSASSSPRTISVLEIVAGKFDASVQVEVVRSLRGTAGKPEVDKLLVALATELPKREKIDADDRAELAAQIASVYRTAKPQGLPDLAGLIGARPDGDAAWNAVAAKPGDAAAGERVFFHPRGAQCFACHRINGRGGVAGPDLSGIGKTLNREKLVDNILHPSKEMAPQFVPWMLKLADERVIVGVIVADDAAGTLTVVDNTGKAHKIKTDDIVERRAEKVSIMPDKLVEQLTVREFRDLLAFLSSLK